MILSNFHIRGKETLRVVQKGTEGIKYELSFKGHHFTNLVSERKTLKCSNKCSTLMSHLANATVGSMLITDFSLKKDLLKNIFLSNNLGVGGRGWKMTGLMEPEKGSPCMIHRSSDPKRDEPSKIPRT